MEKDEKEKQLVDEIRSLFVQLKEMEKGSIVGGMYVLPPDNDVYTQIAQELIGKAYELTKLNANYDSSGLSSVLNKEVRCVSEHKLEYYSNGNVKPISQRKLESLMHDATFHIRLYFWDVLGDIEI